MTLRARLIRLAHENPALRPELVPLLRRGYITPAKGWDFVPIDKLVKPTMAGEDWAKAKRHAQPLANQLKGLHRSLNDEDTFQANGSVPLMLSQLGLVADALGYKSVKAPLRTAIVEFERAMRGLAPATEPSRLKDRYTFG